MDELLQKAAEAIGMPPSLAERSAQARAEKEGTTVEAVLREWAGEAAAPAAPVASDDTSDEGIQDDAATDGSDSADEPANEDDEAAVASLGTEQLLNLAAEAKRMPAKLVLSSAEARARNSGQSVDEVLALWAGVDPNDIAPEADTAAPTAEAPGEAPAATAADEEPETEEEPSRPAAAAAPAAAGAVVVAISMDELLDKVAEAKGMPASLAKRSAEARAKKTGEPLEAVLAEWAGVDPALVDTSEDAGSQESEPQKPPSPAAADDDDAAPESDEEEQSSETVEIIEASAVEEPEDDDIDDDESSLRRSGYPTWLAAAFVLIPLFAVTYILVAPNGPDCGSAGQLKVDEATGLAVNCDGSEYGSDTVDFFADGGAIYTQCAACHGASGEGGAGPAMAGGAVLATFPSGSCDDHSSWISLGTANWPDSTYGATDKPVGGVGVMPSYEGTLTPEQIASVSLYERVQFGGQPLEEAELDCGLVSPEEAEELAEASAP
ncbi:MAG: c-type cytochrome [Acidimicrobiia bacterium]